MSGIPYAWVQAALYLSLPTPPPSPGHPGTPSAEELVRHALAPSPGAEVLADDPGRDPRFHRLVEGIRFGRRFVLTYNLVVLALLLFIAVARWVRDRRDVRELRRRSELAQEDVEDKTSQYLTFPRTLSTGSASDRASSSSASSTLQGTATPPDAVVKLDPADAERQPLLSSHRARSRKRRTLCGTLRSWLMYQPPPIPVVHKTLPSNGTSLFILAFFALNVFYTVYNIPLELPFIFVLADRAGLVFCANLPLLYLLAAKNQPIKLLTGYSYEACNIFHRRLGELLCFEAVIHFLGILAVWYGVLRRLGFSFERFILTPLVLLGIGTFLSYELLYFTSLGSFRQRWYELFLASHVLLQISALVFLWLHYHTSRPFVEASLLIFLVDRLVYRLCLKSAELDATLTVLPDSETLHLSADWDIPPAPSKETNLMFRARGRRNIIYGWKPTDHVFLTVPSLSQKHILQSHPFTIASAAPTPPTDSAAPTHAWLTLLIRAHSGFTSDLLRHATTTSTTSIHRPPPPLRVRLDGPYGSHHARTLLHRADAALLVAAGSGIAVIFPLVWSLLHDPAPPPLPRHTTTNNNDNKKPVRLLWITQHPAHRAWLPADRLRELEDLGLDLVIPPPTKVAGRPDVRAVVAAWIEQEAGRVGVVVSGPDGVTRTVRNACAEQVARGFDVDVAVEKFGW